MGRSTISDRSKDLYLFYSEAVLFSTFQITQQVGTQPNVEGQLISGVNTTRGTGVRPGTFCTRLELGYAEPPMYVFYGQRKDTPGIGCAADQHR